MKIKKFVLSEMGVNCYLISKNSDAILIDASFNPSIIEEYIDSNNFNLKGILLTHAHFDHIGGLEQIRNKYKASVYVHEKERDWLTNPSLNGSDSFPYFGNVTSRPSENLISKENILEIDDFHIKVIHTPGHTPGSITYKINNWLFTGDTLFNHSIGRTDFVGGNQVQLINSIKKKIFIFTDKTIVLPGHGEQTTIGEEKKNNPFLNN